MTILVLVLQSQVLILRLVLKALLVVLGALDYYCEGAAATKKAVNTALHIRGGTSGEKRYFAGCCGRRCKLQDCFHIIYSSFLKSEFERFVIEALLSRTPWLTSRR